MKKIILSILGSWFFITSCQKDFLDEKPLSSFTPETLNDLNGFEAAVVGLQNQYALWHTIGADDVNSQGWLCVWQMGTDVAFNKAVADLDPFAIPYTNYENLTSTDPVSRFAWKWGYNLINNCNVIIKQIDQAKNLNDADKKRIKAEASYFRGLAYNNLATLFGGVPIIIEPLTGPKTDFTRAALAEVNALIISDLTLSKNNLPTINDVKSNSAGKLFARPNKSMASHLLAEVYLRTGDNAKAEIEANEVINSGFFSLTTSRYGKKANQAGDAFSDMFIYGNQRRVQGNKEAIWTLEIENPNNVIGGAGATSSPTFPAFVFGAPQHRRVWGSRYHQQAGMLLADSLGGRGISRMALSYYVLNNLYEKGDMRNSQFTIRRNYYYNNPASPNFGKLVVAGAAGVDTTRFIVPQTTKWDQYDPNDAFGFAMIKDIIIMRLGETYLFKAEAQFKQGNLGGAAETINVLRKRANASLVTASDITMDFILDERIRELLAEENRRMTLMRTKTLVQRAKKGVNITGLSEKHLLLPIPLTEIQLNKDAKLEQNAGY